MALRLLEVLEQRLSERESELEALAFQSLPARLAALLLHEADTGGLVSGYSHQDLADHLGTYRETVSQVLGQFRNAGLIRIGSRSIDILNRDALRAHIGS